MLLATDGLSFTDKRPDSQVAMSRLVGSLTKCFSVYAAASAECKPRRRLIFKKKCMEGYFPTQQYYGFPIADFLKLPVKKKLIWHVF